MVPGISASSINKLFYQVLSAATCWPRELRREERMTVDSPGPVMLEIFYPQQRILTIPARLNSLPATAAETIWVLAGHDDMEFLQFYLKRALDFSDDGETWRAAYGPRLRRWPGTKIQGLRVVTDQLSSIITELRQHPSSRRAIMGLLNPSDDHQNFTAKDFPCTQYLHFLVRKGHLDLDIHIRSNDILWGLTGVNIFEFTVIQELVAGMTGLPVGRYYHIADSLHYYTDYQKRMDSILQSPHFDIYDHIHTGRFKHAPTSSDDSLFRMDNALDDFMVVERMLRHPLGNFQRAMDDACAILKLLPDPLPDICRCMLIYLASRIWDQDREVGGHVIRTVLYGMEDTAMLIGMIEWLTRQKYMGPDFKSGITKLIPPHLKEQIGVFIKKEEI